MLAKVTTVIPQPDDYCKLPYRAQSPILDIHLFIFSVPCLHVNCLATDTSRMRTRVLRAVPYQGAKEAYG